MDGPGNVLVWFRNDLRTNDNPALFEAAKYVEAIKSRQGAGETQLFGLLVTSFYETSQVHHWGLAKADYYLKSATELSKDLAQLGIPLIVHAYPAEKSWKDAVDYYSELGQDISNLCKEYECDVLFMNEEYDGASIERDKRVVKILDTSGISIHQSHDQCAAPVGRILTKAGTPYKVFSQFEKTWRAYIEEHGINILPPPTKLLDCKLNDSLASKMKIPTFPLGFETAEYPELDLEKVRNAFPAGEKAAMTQLERFLTSDVLNYQEDRNHDRKSGASRMSAPLAIGSISIRQCLNAVKRINKGSFSNGHSGSSRWVSELCWRDFYRHVLFHFPQVAHGHSFRGEYESLAWRGWKGGEENEEVEEEFKKWCTGTTGVPIVDAAMRQIRKEAWMSNRVRMIVAMYLTKDLLIHWRRGERFFMENLIDYDYSSNNGGWQWSASTGTDAQPYFRIFNPLLQSEKFDPTGGYIRKYVSELFNVKAPAIHEPHSRLPKAEFVKLDYPSPMVDHAKAKIKVISLFTNAKLTNTTKTTTTATLPASFTTKRKRSAKTMELEQSESKQSN